jgi:hypothetical protein
MYAMTSQTICSLPMEIWIPRARQHTLLMEKIVDPFLKRRSLGLHHPVHDFLFTYYSFSPSKLKQWIPSFEENLWITNDLLEQYSWFNNSWFCIDENLLSHNKERMQKSIHGIAKFVAQLCGNILQKAPRFACHGLHEWAMVYKSHPDSIRHAGYRLRLDPEELANFIEKQTICCSHYDAYRFFTEEARPLNILNPKLDTRLQMEQGGCVHANMDLYKWATKLWPWIGSDFIAKTFFLALEGRELDMRASPYDLSEDGYSPICIETEEGRKQYQKEQQLYAERASLLRKELQEICTRLIQ